MPRCSWASAPCMPPAALRQPGLHAKKRRPTRPPRGAPGRRGARGDAQRPEHVLAGCLVAQGDSRGCRALRERQHRHAAGPLREPRHVHVRRGWGRACPLQGGRAAEPCLAAGEACRAGTVLWMHVGMAVLAVAEAQAAYAADRAAPLLDIQAATLLRWGTPVSLRAAVGGCSAVTVRKRCAVLSQLRQRSTSVCGSSASTCELRASALCTLGSAKGPLAPALCMHAVLRMKQAVLGSTLPAG
jgi:hypothetical protein